jgi:hypothetical protein
VKTFLCATLFLAAASAAFAEDYRYEVLAVTGNPTLTEAGGSSRALAEGDTLKTGDVLKTGENDTLTLSQDGEWKNTAYVESGSTIVIKSVLPAKMELQNGSVFAKLKSLPKNSSFSVQTPTAVASVRGTEYRVRFESGDTQVFNFSESKVFVYAPGPDGEAFGAPLELTHSQKTEISRGEAPSAPSLMTYEDTGLGQKASAAVESQIREAETEGRVAKIQKVEEMIVSSGSSSGGGVTEEESRVIDTRRRAFKKT